MTRFLRTFPKEVAMTTIDVAPIADMIRSRGIRRTGLAALVAAASIAVTPITVFLIPWTALDPAWSDPTAKNDLALSAPLWWLGLIYGLQGLALASAMTVAGFSVAPALGTGPWAKAGRMGAAGFAVMWLAIGAINAAMHSAAIAPDLVAVQADPAIRKMVGFAEILVMQGLAGSAGLCGLVWLLSVALCGRRAQLFGRGPLIVVTAFGVLMVAAYLFGYAAAATLLIACPLVMVGIRLLAASRRS